MRHFIVTDALRSRLDSWLASASGISRTEAQRLIDRGLVEVDGSRRGKSWRMTLGEVVDVKPEMTVPASRAPAPFVLRFEDDHLAVVYKPPGVIVHPTAGGAKDETLVEALAKVMDLAGGEAGRPGVIHRLDKDTSGLLVFAKTEESFKRLSTAMRERKIEREYVAMVLGSFEAPFGRVEAPVGRSARNPTKMSVTQWGRDAATEFRVLEKLGKLSLLRLRLLTGRTHQIRVHLAHIDRPVVGDRTYGRRTLELAGAIGLARPFLHAGELSFEHPFVEGKVAVSEDLPRDLQSALECARTQQRTQPGKPD